MLNSNFQRNDNWHVLFWRRSFFQKMGGGEKYTHKSISLILVTERCSQQHETTLTLIMNLETLATPDRYVYVGLARSRRLFFPANLHRDLESTTRDTPLAEQDGGTSWKARSTKRKRMQEEKGDRAGHTWQCTTKAWWMRGRLVYVIETWSPADGVVRLSVSFLFLSHWNGLSSVFRPFHVVHVTHENSNHPCHRSDRSYCHILRTREKLLP